MYCDVEAQALVERRDVAALDLPQPGDPGPDLEAMRVPELVARGLERRRSRADERHVAAQDVEQLRELVEARRAQEPSHPRDPRVVRDLEVRRRQHAEVCELGLELLRVGEHRPELQHPEATAVAPGAGLGDEHRPRGVQPDRQRADEDDRDRDDEQDDAEREVQEPLGHRIPPRSCVRHRSGPSGRRCATYGSRQALAVAGEATAAPWRRCATSGTQSVMRESMLGERGDADVRLAGHGGRGPPESREHRVVAPSRVGLGQEDEERRAVRPATSPVRRQPRSSAASSSSGSRRR